MRDLTSVIDEIRTVREARRRFLRLWRLERLPHDLASAPAALDRLASDISRAADYFSYPARASPTTSEVKTILASRINRLFPHGRLSDD